MRAIDASLIEVPLRCRSKRDCIETLLDRLLDSGLVSDRGRVLEEILAREETSSTAIGYGAAIPHARSDHVLETVCAFGNTLDPGVEFGTRDDGSFQLANLIFLIVSPRRDTTHHIKALARIARLVKDEPRRQALSRTREPEKVLELLGDLAQKPAEARAAGKS